MIYNKINKFNFLKMVEIDQKYLKPLIIFNKLIQTINLNK